MPPRISPARCNEASVMSAVVLRSRSVSSADARKPTVARSPPSAAGLRTIAHTPRSAFGPKNGGSPPFNEIVIGKILLLLFLKLPYQSVHLPEHLTKLIALLLYLFVQHIV